MDDHWKAIAGLVGRYRGALLGGIASAAALALTLDPAATLAHSSLRFAMWFGVLATIVTAGLTGVLALAETRAARIRLPRATARKLLRSPPA